MIRRLSAAPSCCQTLSICVTSGCSKRSRCLFIGAPFCVINDASIAGGTAVSKSGDQFDQVAQRVGRGLPARVDLMLGGTAQWMVGPMARHLAVAAVGQSNDPV